MIANTYLYKIKLQATEETLSKYARFVRCDSDYQKMANEHNERKEYYDYMVKSPNKKVNAHLVNRLGVCIHELGYNHVSVWPTMDSAMDEAYSLTNERNLCANIIDREMGNILVQYENGKIIWQDKSTLPR